ncbi:hypothetical protein MRX96_010725 [Rhipicephalus microplus]
MKEPDNLGENRSFARSYRVGKEVLCEERHAMAFGSQRRRQINARCFYATRHPRSDEAAISVGPCAPRSWLYTGETNTHTPRDDELSAKPRRERRRAEALSSKTKGDGIGPCLLVSACTQVCPVDATDCRGTCNIRRRGLLCRRRRWLRWLRRPAHRNAV